MAKLTHDVIIKATDKASGAFKAVGKSSKGLQENIFQLTSIASNLINIGGSMVNAFKSVAGAMGDMVALSNEQIKVETQLEAVLKSTKGAVGLTADELKRMATAFQQTTTFGDEAVIAGQNILLTFKQIGGADGVFERTTAVVLDVATAMGMDLKSSALQVGKALNSPKEGLSMLTRVGITFSEEQKNLIGSLQETGDLAAAQGIILEELESQFGGSAVAMRDTFGGALESLKNAWNDLRESVGKFITENEGLIVFVEALISIIEREIEKIDRLSESMEGNTEVAEMLQAGLVRFIEFAAIMVDAIGHVVDALTFWSDEGEEAANQLHKVADGIRDTTKAIAAIDIQKLVDEKAAIDEVIKAENDLLIAKREKMSWDLEYEAILAGIRERHAAEETIIKEVEALKRWLETQKEIRPARERERDAYMATKQAALEAAEGLKVYNNRVKEVLTPIEAFKDSAWESIEALRQLGKKDVTQKATKDLLELNEALKDGTLDGEEAVAAYKKIAAGLESVAGSAAKAAAIKPIVPPKVSADPAKVQEQTNAGKEKEGELIGDAVDLLHEKQALERESQITGRGGAKAKADVVRAERNLVEVTKKTLSTSKDQEATEKNIVEVASQRGLAEEGINALRKGGMKEVSEGIKKNMKEGETAHEKKTNEIKTIGELQKEVIKDTLDAQEESLNHLRIISEATAKAVGDSWEEAARQIAMASANQLIFLNILGIDIRKWNASSESGFDGEGNPMAHGGFVDSPTHALIGEAGPETVIPESRPGRARDLLASMFARNPELAPNQAVGGGSGSVSITVNNMMGDGNEIANTLASRMDEILGRRALG